MTRGTDKEGPPLKTRFHLPHIGLRTAKTAASVILAMVIVDAYGASSARLIFAMLGAMSAVQPTFKGSVQACATQISGVIFGALAGVVLLGLGLPPLAATGVGIVALISLYNGFQVQLSPSLPCLVLVTVCTTGDIQPMDYALNRIWDTAIGLGVGMAINTLVFPYDNSLQIRNTAQSLEREVIRFLEDMFDGDENFPKAETMTRQIDLMTRQLKVFSDQRLLLHRRRQREQLAAFRLCQGRARVLVAHMEVLGRMEAPGVLSQENRQALENCGARILDPRTPGDPTDTDIVTNYHVSQILRLRGELIRALGKD